MNYIVQSYTVLVVSIFMSSSSLYPLSFIHRKEQKGHPSLSDEEFYGNEDPILIDVNGEEFPVDIDTVLNDIRKEYPTSSIIRL